MTVDTELEQKTEKFDERELKRVGRKELIEMLYEMRLREEALEKELAETKKELEEQQIILDEAGSIAEASLRIHKVFETAQVAADEYLLAIKQSQENSEHVIEENLEEAKKKADGIVAEAEKKRLETDIRCEKKLAETEQQIQERWTKFEEKVQKTLKAHAELAEIVNSVKPV